MYRSCFYMTNIRYFMITYFTATENKRALDNRQWPGGRRYRNTPTTYHYFTTGVNIVLFIFRKIYIFLQILFCRFLCTYALFL